MKDKLVKSGHRRHYYLFRRAAKGFFIAASLAIIASVPVLIAYGVSVTQTLAEEAPKENSAEPEIEVSSYSSAS